MCCIDRLKSQPKAAAQVCEQQFLKDGNFMNTATATAAEIDEVTPTDLGKRFIRWGLNLYLTGFISGLVPVLHYMHGAVAGDIGDHFMKNMTLWWGCPAVLMELTLKTGGLGMLVVGLCYIVLSQGSGTKSVSNK
jgi:hypothetical protein